MSRYGDMPPMAPTLLLIGFSLVLGLYFGVFALTVALVQRRTGSVRMALCAGANCVDCAGTGSFPNHKRPLWDPNLGYSQVDNQILNQLAPWTGVYGISFVLVAAECVVGRLH